jgi:hypothetical protein
VQETHAWDSEWLAEHGVRAAFGLYLVKAGEATFCCEITPSSRADWLSNAFVLADDAPEDDSERESAEYEGGDSTYLRFFDPAEHDSRFFAALGDPLEECPDHVTDDASQWDIAREWQSTNPLEPAILWTETFDLWEAEQTAKRRAENRAPLDHLDQLPLFAAALESARKARGWHDLAAVSDVDGQAEWAEVRALGWA